MMFKETERERRLKAMILEYADEIKSSISDFSEKPFLFSFPQKVEAGKKFQDIKDYAEKIVCLLNRLDEIEKCRGDVE